MCVGVCVGGTTETSQPLDNINWNLRLNHAILIFHSLTCAHTFPSSSPPTTYYQPHPTQTGACGGETACSTCHLYVDPAFFKKLPEISEAEEDMLDLAAGLKDNSRLGCQVFAAENIDGIVVEMPKEVNNLKG